MLLLNFISRYLKDERGSISFIGAASLITLVVAAGISADLGKSIVVRDKLQHSIDLAALAASVHSKNLDAIDTAMIGRRYFRMNVPMTFMGSRTSTLNLDAEFLPSLENPEQVQFSMDAEIRTNFIQLNNSNATRPRVAVEVEVELSDKAIVPADISLVLDFSGSMLWTDCATFNRNNESCTGNPNFDGKSRMQQLHYIYNTFLDSIFSDEKTEDYRISVAAYSRYLKGDTLFTSNKNELQRFFIQTHKGGGTDGSVGVRKSLEHFNTTTRNDDTPKIMFILTDGVNNRVDDDRQMISACSKGKRDDILIYTVAFGPDVFRHPRVRQVMDECASSAEKSFRAKNAADLNSVFQHVLKETRKTRIVK